MSKSNTQILILPGETGWEIWSCPTGGAFELQHATDLVRLGELVNIPSGELTLLFPLRSITTLPMRVMTAEENLFEDLAGLHAERLGMRADPLAGQLSDLFVIAREHESAVLLSVWLKPPGEGELPVVSPGAFDFSARATPVDGSAVVVWRELGRWVFAIHQSSKLLYAQATSCISEHPDATVAGELKLALMQLSLQGLEPKPNRIVVWNGVVGAAHPPTSSRDLRALRDAFDLPVEIHERPAPVLPDPISKLLPEDVRAARRETQRKQRIQLAVGGVAAIYIALLAWLGYGFWQGSRKVADLEEQADIAAPEAAAYTLHMERWHELADVIDIDHSPVEILHRVAGCIPQNAGLRLSTADIDPYAVTIIGEAPSLEAVNQFSLKLSKNPSLSRYVWSLPDSKPSTRGREFRYQGSAQAPAQAP